jgi:nucleoside-diphosphate-sugar epimerase
MEIAVRILADILLINAALIIALALQYIWLINVESAIGSPKLVIHDLYSIYSHNSPWITLIGIIVFYFNGFYTYGRLYRGRYKIIIILQSVSLAYLTYGLMPYLIKSMESLPRSVLLVSWCLTLLFLIASRLWSMLWKNILLKENGVHSDNLNQGPNDKVLVIGGAGYIGSALIPKLLEKDYHVRVLDLLLFGVEPIAPFLNHPNLEIIQADFRQVDKVVEAMQGVGSVIHLGGIVGDPACSLDEKLTIEVNLMATKMICEVAQGAGVKRFIFASTCSVYGAGDEILDEHSGLRPVSLYARSKIASERVILERMGEGFYPVILRFGTIFGLSGRTRFDLVVNLLTAKAILDGQITVFGGDQWRPFVHVDDAALAIFQSLDAPISKVNGQILNVGGNENNYTIQQVGEIIHRMVPGAEIIIKGTDSDRRNYRVNFNKIHRMLDFKPRWSVESGVRQVIEAFQAGKIKDYNKAKYSNVKSLTEESSTLNGEFYANRWAYELIRKVS